jgi:hypothetical protein
MANQVPEKLINFRVYLDGNDLIGVADVELPSIEAMTETVKGAGIAGEIDSPTLGHFGSMTCTLNWRTVEKPTLSLAAQKAHNLDLRGANQVYDAGLGEYIVRPVKVVLRAVPKTSVNLGNLDVGVSAGASNQFEILYIKVDVDGSTMVEIDKLNYICKIDGIDYLAQVRVALGLD